MRYEVRVKFNKDFVKMENGAIIVGVLARPEKGKANKEIIRKISGYFGVPVSSVKIVSGIKSKRKFVEVEK